MMIYGLAATLELLRVRPSQIECLIVDSNHSTRELATIVRQAKALSIRTSFFKTEELNQRARSTQHQGVIALCREKQRLSDDQMLAQVQMGPLPLIYLDGVANPHNLGAMIRTAAHFGIPYIIGKKEYIPKSSPSLIRTASGGFEHIEIVECDDELRLILKLKKMGYTIAILTQHSSSSLFQHTFQGPYLFAFGSERDGVSPTLEKLADLQLCIPGTGKVESLNVSVSTAITLAFWAKSQT